MRGICNKTPWGLRRQIQKHSHETGVVVYGWFSRLRNWPEASGWENVSVYANGGNKSLITLHKFSRGPFWISLPPGEHRLEFNGPKGILRSEIVNLEEDVILIAFKPPRQILFRKSAHEQWCVRKLQVS